MPASSISRPSFSASSSWLRSSINALIIESPSIFLASSIAFE
ncbi:hypothetical protein [Vulcanisaeta sp. JCM 16161]